MRYAVALMLLLSVMVMVGCKPQAKGPQTTSVEPPAHPMESLAPASDTTPPPPAMAASPQVVETSTPKPLVPPRTYTVEKGDTIYKIARKFFNTDARAKDIIAANPGIDANHIKVGQVINLPEK